MNIGDFCTPLRCCGFVFLIPLPKCGTIRHNPRVRRQSYRAPMDHFAWPIAAVAELPSNIHVGNSATVQSASGTVNEITAMAQRSSMTTILMSDALLGLINGLCAIVGAFLGAAIVCAVVLFRS